MNDMDEVVKEFLIESYENLDQLDRDLLTLETDPSHKETLSSVFRTIHTIKGTCGFLGFSKLESLSHVGESLLSRLRDGELLLNTEITNGLLAMVDAVREILARVESTEVEGDGDYQSLIERLTELQTGEAPVAVPPLEAVATPEVETAPEATPEAEASPLPAVGGPRRIDEAPVEQEDTKPRDETQAVTGGQGLSESNVRVDVEILDRLMNLVGELVLARNQVLQLSMDQEDARYQATSQQLNLLTTELQEGVMKTRMQPIGNVWGKFRRVVRDLSMACGKKIRLEMEGGETEIDKTIIEAIKDPLTHIVRNSVDHGIETPDIRIAAGKSEEGHLYLRAFHEGGQVNIEIVDDGGGINFDRVKEKAIQNGVTTAEQAARMSERELANLVFLPGLSTAKKVTNVSGRGVGMDVVKTNIEKIGGTIDIQSKLGGGTKLRIKIPLTLAIIPALTVDSGGDRYAIPQVSLLELLRIDGELGRNRVEMVQGVPVYRLRGKLLPLVYLSQILGQTPSKSNGDGHEKDDVVNIVVLQAEGRQFGLVVENIRDTEEIVVKPLGNLLTGLSVYSGATIMGDGTVALILDVLGLAQRSHALSEVGERRLASTENETAAGESDRRALLVFALGKSSRMAMPLSLVRRLEEIPRSKIEHTTDHDVVQYRGEIMPLVWLSDVLGLGTNETAEESDVLHVVVYSENDRSVGFVVGQILDVVKQSITVQRDSKREGVLGSVVIQDQVTELVDVGQIIRMTGLEFPDSEISERPIAVAVGA